MSEDEIILSKAKDLFKKDKDHWDSLVYGKAKEDLVFLSDEDGAQWNPKEFEMRSKTGRTALQIDYLKQFVNQVANEIRQQERVADVVPVGAQGSVETSEVIKGLLKKIQYDCSAEEAYSTGITSAIKCSIGFIKVDHDWEDESDQDNSNQVIKIDRVINPFVIYLDSTSIALNGSDANHSFELETMTVREFKSRWPDHEPCSFEGDTQDPVKDDEDVVVAHFHIRAAEEQMLKDEDGEVTRTLRKYSISKYILSGSEVLEKGDSPFKYIPLIPVYGEEAWEDGKRKIHSLIRKSKQSQSQYNLLQSIKTDILLKHSRANVMVAEGSIEQWAEDWKNPDKAMALRYAMKDEEGNALNPPEFLAPPQASLGLIQAAEGSVNDIRATIGMYQANLGMEGNEVSGKAIDSRKIEGDNSTYHFGDNGMHSIEQVCRTVISAIPVIYGAQRIIQILDDEEDPDLVGINGMTTDGQQVMHNLATGKYDVRVTVGASYTTQRQEAEEFLKELVSGNPQLMTVFGDLLFKYADFAGADQMSARMKKLLPPQLQDNEGQDPQVAALQSQLQQAMGIIQQLKAEVADKSEDRKVKIAQIAASHDQVETGHQINLMKHATDAVMTDRKLDLQEQKQAGDIVLDAAKLHMDNVIGQMKAVDRQTLPKGNPAAVQGAGNNGRVQ